MRTFDEEALTELRTILAARPAAELPVGELRRACVLIPLIQVDGEWWLIFMQRAIDKTMHSGQIAFPGGAAEPGETLEEAALREAHEEVGIPSEGVELIGRLDDLFTISGYVVAPFVGLIRQRREYILQVAEVAEVFEVPLTSLLAEDNPQITYVQFRGRTHPAYSYHHNGRVIWGLTGRIVKGFLDLVRLTV